MPNYLRRQSPWIGGAQLAEGLAKNLDAIQRQKLQEQQMMMMAPVQGAQARATYDATVAKGRSDTALEKLREAQATFRANQNDYAQQLGGQVYGLNTLQQPSVATNGMAALQPNVMFGNPAVDANTGQQAQAAQVLATLAKIIGSNPAAAERMGNPTLNPGQSQQNMVYGNIQGQPQFHSVPQGAIGYMGDKVLSGNIMTPRGGITTQPNGQQIMGQPVMSNGIGSHQNLVSYQNNQQTALDKLLTLVPKSALPGGAGTNTMGQVTPTLGSPDNGMTPQYSALTNNIGWANQQIRGQAPAMPVNAPASTNAPTTIRVQHPNGQFGFIPSDQLQEALSTGYKLAPQ